MINNNKNKEEVNGDLENNQYFSKELMNKLDLKRFPVAIKFILHENDIPSNIKKINDKIRHCEMVMKASKGDTFYSTSNEQLCKGGSAALGLEDMPKKIATGEFYQKLGRFKTLGSAKRTLNEIPKIDFKSYGIIYCPLNKANFIPDVIIIIANPKQAMILSQAIVFTLGGRIEANFAGIQSLCADAVCGPFVNKQANVTVGCTGSRKFAKLNDDELAIGLNGENIGCVVNALNTME